MANFYICVSLLIVLKMAAFPLKASAYYYDPGIGSIATQIIFAGWLAAVVAFGQLQRRFSNCLKGNIFGAKQAQDDTVA